MGSSGRAVYRNRLADSSRWERFPFRAGDIVISTPPKCGTTWMQMICALLIFQDPALPARLTTLSPWLDMRLRPVDEVRAALAAQTHRRFIKTHTPLDGLPAADGVTYVTVGRHPLDVAVSLDHHRANLDFGVIARLLAPEPATRPVRPADRRRRLLQWIHDERPPTENLDSLRGLVRHLAGAWDRRDEPGVVLVHHAALSRDLEGEMRRLADRLDISVAARRWPGLVEAATFRAMRTRAADLVPDEHLGLIADCRAFFRSGTSRQWTDMLTAGDLADYEALLRSLAPADLAAWLPHGHEDRGSP